MIDKNDWRLLNDVDHLRGAYINPTDGEEIVFSAMIRFITIDINSGTCLRVYHAVYVNAALKTLTKCLSGDCLTVTTYSGRSKIPLIHIFKGSKCMISNIPV